MNWEILYKMEAEENERIIKHAKELAKDNKKLQNDFVSKHNEVLKLLKMVSELEEKNKQLECEAQCNNKVATKLENILGNIIQPDKNFNQIYE